jgi:hypothetical protein
MSDWKKNLSASHYEAGMRDLAKKNLTLVMCLKIAYEAFEQLEKETDPVKILELAQSTTVKMKQKLDNKKPDIITECEPVLPSSSQS